MGVVFIAMGLSSLGCTADDYVRRTNREAKPGEQPEEDPEAEQTEAVGEIQADQEKPLEATDGDETSGEQTNASNPS